MEIISTVSDMDLAGGAPCLDFVNTRLNYHKPVERLHTYADLLTLARRCQLLPENTIEDLQHFAEKERKKAQDALDKAKQVRGAMLSVFQSIADGTPPRNLDSFNNAVIDALAQRQFAAQPDFLGWDWKAGINLLQPIWAFTYSAFKLLQDQDQRLIKKCSGCAWLFIDQTKNHRRRWCDMQTCGSVSKSKQYYQRKKNNAPSS